MFIFLFLVPYDIGMKSLMNASYKSDIIHIQLHVSEFLFVQFQLSRLSKGEIKIFCFRTIDVTELVKEIRETKTGS